MELSDLGNRICIMGPSNSGKSTLANAISRKSNLKAIHLDLLFHLPHTDWQERPIDEFISLHEMAIKEDNWVIDGNYRKYLSQRLSRATGVILLDISTT
ncbi:GTPase [Xenorhabdus kozodoii]|uniref:ATPase AAA n=1 Tax=Xenorhabdus kozodoii TaxID=351676 RepID=A0A2D0L864_9GAMM|nr:GTPase [Xenorhabdus kozodoii]PHM71881.1 ATPase AAA [Xenorhabdus kozodoii]